VSRLSEAVKLYLKVQDIGTRQVAEETNMSHATISRFLNGKKVDSEHFLAIINWLAQPQKREEE
jgi:transcriptional regulator with XRE-family HTH domain